MAWTVQLDPAEVSTPDRVALDLNNGPIRIAQTGIDWGDAQITAFEAQEQRWGSTVVGWRVPNRTVTIPLGVGMDESGGFSVSAQHLRQKVALIQREGGWLKRGPIAGKSLYADVVNATLKLPDVWGETGGLEDQVILTLECLPDFYGDEITLDAVGGNGSVATLLRSGGQPAVIQGDHPGRVRVDLQDTSGNTQYGLLWALRSRYYDPAAPLIVPYTSISAASAAGAVADSGATTGTMLAVSPPAANTPTQLCFGLLPHSGTYQVWARLRAPGRNPNNCQVEFAWNIGDTSHGTITDGWIGLQSGWQMVNLGQIRIDPVTVGVQQWGFTLSVQAGIGGDTIGIDRLILQPLDEAAGLLIGQPTLSDPIMLPDGGVELAWDGAMRSAPTGSAFLPVARTFGDMPRIPPSGLEARPVELLAKLSRGDLGFDANQPDIGPTDSFTAAVSYRPSYLFHP